MVIFKLGFLFTKVVNCINHNAIHTSNLGYPIISGVSCLFVFVICYTPIQQIWMQKKYNWFDTEHYPNTNLYILMFVLKVSVSLLIWSLFKMMPFVTVKRLVERTKKKVMVNVVTLRIHVVYRVLVRTNNSCSFST